MNQLPPPVLPPPPPPPTTATYDAPQRPMDGFSVAALVLGICGLFFGWLWVIPPILGVVFGAVSLRRISQSNNWKTGRGMAIAGLTCGIVGTLIWGYLAIGVIAAQN